MDLCCDFSHSCPFIPVTSPWASWRLKSPAHRLFVSSFIWTYIKENIKTRITNPLWGESTGDLVDSPHRGPVMLKPFHLMSSWWLMDKTEEFPNTTKHNTVVIMCTLLMQHVFGENPVIKLTGFYHCVSCKDIDIRTCTRQQNSLLRRSRIPHKFYRGWSQDTRHSNSMVLQDRYHP